ncbi:Kelch repeat-containing protein, partial [Globisporangium splendens]
MSPMRWTPLAVQGTTPTIKNHSATVISSHEILVFGGYDGRRNHNELYLFDCRTYTWRELVPSRDVRGTPPAGRNGHTATLADDNKVFIIGGWLGSGPLAADDLHVLDLDRWQWHQPSVKGSGPGPCNMHTADYLPHLRSILLFRGGDGREYLNDLHALNIDLMEWRKIHATGEIPVPRANHSSAVVGEQVLVFGGWDGQKRLNDIHILDTNTFTWSRADVKAPLPHPRAGMTFSCHRDRIFLFGGSGPSAKCYNDLHIYEPSEKVWIETLQLPADDDRGSVHGGGIQENEMGGVTLTPQQLVDYGMYGDGDANPNDNPHQDQIVIFGNGPGRRAGHSCSVVDRKLFVFGGSYGSEYLNDFYVLDTDPPPRAAISFASSTQTLQQSLKYFMNSEEFSDISFKQIALPDIRYVVFLKMIEYLYTGHAVEGSTHRRAPSPYSRKDKLRDNHGRTQQQQGRWSSFHPSDARDVRAARACLAFVDDDEDEFDEAIADDDEDDDEFIGSTGDMDTTLDLLILADQFMLDHLKQICERALQYSVTDESVDYILDAADRSNALQLKAICMHFLRNQDASARYTTYHQPQSQDQEIYSDHRRHSIE